MCYFLEYPFIVIGVFRCTVLATKLHVVLSFEWYLMLMTGWMGTLSMRVDSMSKKLDLRVDG